MRVHGHRLPRGPGPRRGVREEGRHHLPEPQRRVRASSSSRCRARRRPCPTTLVLDTEGRIAARVNGPVSASTLRGLVDDVVAGRDRRPPAPLPCSPRATRSPPGRCPLAVGVAALAGLVSFASPCVLPLVPGLPRLRHRADRRAARRAVARADGDRGAALRRRASPRSSCSARSSSPPPGRALIEHRTLLMRLGGVVVILMGLVFLGVGEPARGEDRLATARRPGRRPGARRGLRPGLGAVHRPDPRRRPRHGDGHGGPAGGAQRRARDGIRPRALGLPFVLIAAGLDRAGRASGWLRRHQRTIQVVGGVMLVLVGLLMVTGAVAGPQHAGSRPSSSTASRCRCERPHPTSSQPRLGPLGLAAVDLAAAHEHAHGAVPPAPARDRRHPRARPSRSARSTPPAPRSGSPTTRPPGRCSTGWASSRSTRRRGSRRSTCCSSSRSSAACCRARGSSGTRCARRPPRAPRRLDRLAAHDEDDVDGEPGGGARARCGRPCASAATACTPTTTRRSPPRRATCARPATSSSTSPSSACSSASRGGTSSAGRATSSCPSARPSPTRSRATTPSAPARGSTSTTSSPTRSRSTGLEVEFETETPRPGPVRRAARLRGVHDVHRRRRAQRGRARIRVNQPLETGGGSVFLLGNGYAPRITVRDAEGTVLYSDATPFLPQDNNYTSVGAVKVPGAVAAAARVRRVLPADRRHRRPGPALGLPRRARPPARAHGLRGRALPQRAAAVGLLARHRGDDARSRQGRRRPAAHPAAPGRDLRAARRARARSPSTGSSGSPGCRSAPTPARRLTLVARAALARRARRLARHPPSKGLRAGWSGSEPGRTVVSVGGLAKDDDEGMPDEIDRILTALEGTR